MSGRVLTTIRASVSSGGAQGNRGSIDTSISADGRYVAFWSHATNLVAGDTNGTFDTFVRDVQTGTTTLVSASGSGAQGNSGSGAPSISADGRYVAFWSHASNLVVGDTNSTDDIFVRDLQAGTTTLVSASTAGAQGNSPSYNADISTDGRYVTFQSDASNLVAGDTNSFTEIFVRDIQAETTTLVSASSAGVQVNGESFDPSISADGRYVTFRSSASNLVVGDTNGTADIFVRDIQAGTTTLVSLSSAGARGNNESRDPSISADGRYVAFWSHASNLVAGDTNGAPDIFVRDIQAGTTVLVSSSSAGVQGNSSSDAPSISADGRYVAFQSDASNLVAGDTNGTFDIFVRDIQAGTTILVSASSAGAERNKASFEPSISADGRSVAFVSSAANLVAGDTNGTTDIFVTTVSTPDTAPPSLTITAGNTTFRNSGTAQITITASEAISGLAAAGVTVTGGAIGDLATIDNITFTTLFTPSTNQVGRASLVIMPGSYADLAGNPGAAGELSFVVRGTVFGGAGDDTLLGGPGDDMLLDMLGDNRLEGGAGDDTLQMLAGSDGFNRLDGGAGNDVLYGGAGGNIVAGGDGDDVLNGGLGDDTLRGGDGADRLFGLGGRNLVEGDAGNDSIVATGLLDTLRGGDGADNIMNGGGSVAEVDGGDGDDYINLSAADGALIEGGTGNDTIFAFMTAWQSLNGGLGNDDLTILAGGRLTAGSVDGGDGDDRLSLSAAGPLDPGVSLVGIETLRVTNVIVSNQPGVALDISAAQLSGITRIEAASGQGPILLRASVAGDYDLSGKVIAAPLILTGSAGDDTLTGTAADDTLRGGDGDDVLIDGAGNDTLEGGAGNDALNDAAGGGTLHGGTGDDALILSALGESPVVGLLSGGEGNDYFHALGRNASITIEGGDGADTIFALASIPPGQTGSFLVTVDAGAGDDRLDVGGIASGSVLDGGAGQDTFSIFGSLDPGVTLRNIETLQASGTISLTAGQFASLSAFSGSIALRAGDAGTYEFTGKASGGVFRLDGSAGDDVIRGVTASWSGAFFADAGAGNDLIESAAPGGNVIRGGLGNDTIRSASQTGSDMLLGGAGDDSIEGGAIWNNMYGEEGNDTIISGSSGGFVQGDAGDDLLTGGMGIDHLDGGDGHDTLSGGEGNDNLFGRDGDDSIEGGAGNDTVDGGAGRNQLFGGEGNDWISSRAGDALLVGGDGNDNLNGVGGNNTLFGGAGNDFLGVGNAGGSANLIEGGDGNDIILDNSAGSTLRGGVGNDSITTGQTAYVEGGEGDDQILVGSGGLVDGGLGNDFISLGLTSNAETTLRGGAGKDTISLNIADGRGPTGLMDAGEDDDLVYLSNGVLNGPITLEGGTGNDTLSMGQMEIAASVIVSGFETLKLQAIGQDWRQIDGQWQVFEVEQSASLSAEQLAGFQAIEGTAYSRELGMNVPSVFRLNATTAGHYNLSGKTITGSAILIGSSGDDTLTGTAADDTLQGGEGDDVLIGGTGNDLLEGGAGFDTAVFAGRRADYTISFAPDGTLSLAETDTLRGIERLLFVDMSVQQAAGGGQIIAANGHRPANLTGGATNDAVAGGDGADTLNGGEGTDTLTGGGGQDRFVGTAAQLNGDRIADYAAEEVILVQDARFTAADVTLTRGSTIISVDTDQDGDTDLTITLSLDLPELQALGLVLDVTDTPEGTVIRFIPGATNAGPDLLTVSGAVGADVVLDGGAGNDTLLAATAVFDPAATIRDVETLIVAGPSVQLSAVQLEGFTSIGRSNPNQSFAIIATTPGEYDLSAVVTDGRSFGLTGSAGADTLRAALDVMGMNLVGQGGDDLIIGSAGNDMLVGGQGNDTLEAGDGNDSLFDFEGDNLLDGGAGADFLNGGGNSTLRGGTGADSISYVGPVSRIEGGDGDDVISAFANTSPSLTLHLDAGAGDDRISISSLVAGGSLLDGGAGEDRLTLVGAGLEAGVTLANIETLLLSGFETRLSAAQIASVDRIEAQSPGASFGIRASGAGVYDLSATPTPGLSQFQGSDGADEVIAPNRFILLLGGAGDDTLRAGDAGSNLQGGGPGLAGLHDGNDLLVGGAGNDFMEGGTGQNTLLGGGGFNSLTDKGRDSLLVGGDGRNVFLSEGSGARLHGGAGDDLFSIAGRETEILGGAGTDLFDLRGLSLGGVLDGGAGMDTLVVQPGTVLNTTAVIRDMEWLSIGYGDGGNPQTAAIALSGAQLTGFANIGVTPAPVPGPDYAGGLLTITATTAGSYVLAGKFIGAKVTLVGTVGDDYMLGGSASESLLGGAGHDRLNGGGGADLLDGGDGNDGIWASGDSTVLGGAGDDSISADAAASRIEGGDGNDSIAAFFDGDSGRAITLQFDAGAGDDRITVTNAVASGSVLDGGAGNDQLTLRGTGLEVGARLVNIETLVVQRPDALLSAAQIASVERVEGAGFTASVAGLYDLRSKFTADLAVFFGSNGADEVLGPNKNVAIFGGAGSDTILAGDAGGYLDGGYSDQSADGDDVLIGGAGRDTLQGGSGQNTLSGGAGFDVAAYDGGLLADHIVTGGNGSYIVRRTHPNGAVTEDILTDIERVVFDDGAIDLQPAGQVITAAPPPAGNSEGADLTGGAGNDSITGNAGEDTLAGDAGQDVLDGGASDDTLNGGLGADTLTGGAGEDSYVGTAAELNGDRITDYAAGEKIIVENSSFTAADVTLTRGSTIISVDTDQDGDIDLTITLEQDLPELQALGLELAVTPGANGTVIVFVAPSTPAVSQTGSPWGGATLTGGAGPDTLIGRGWNNLLLGGAGHDVLDGGEGQAVIDAGSGNNIILLDGWNNHVTAGPGNNVVERPDGNSRVALGDGVASVTLDGWSNQVTIGDTPTSGRSVIQAGQGDSVVTTGGGSVDVALSGWGNRIEAGQGALTVSGSAGNSSVQSGGGPTSITMGGWGNQIAVGSGSAHLIDAGMGNARVTVAGGDATITARGWNNEIRTGDGHDIIAGMEGSSFVWAGDGDNRVTASGWWNQIETGSGADRITSGAGGAQVKAGAGNDEVRLAGWHNTVDAGAGDDTIFAGEGSDRFVLNAAGSGVDQIFDFQEDVSDQLEFRGVSISQVSVQTVGGDLSVVVDTSQVAVLVGKGDLTMEEMLANSSLLFA